MPTSLLMSMGTRAMFAANAQLNTIGNNIANVNTPGYSRQMALQSATESQYNGAGFFGRGVTVQTVTRATNMFLTQQSASASAVASATGVRHELLSQMEKVFGIGASGLGSTATQLYNAFADLAASPADLSARQAVLARAEDLASSSRFHSDQIENLQARVRTDVGNAVDVVNGLAKQVAGLNNRIVLALATGAAPNDLLDAREQLIQKISDKVEVHTIAASDGSMSVFVAGGQNLVLAGHANEMVAREDEFDRSRASVAISVSGQVTPLDSRALGGGALSGLLAFQDVDLAEARNRLGQMSAGLAQAMNAQQSYGIDLQGNAGADLFSFGKPVALPSRSNAQPQAQITLAITDPKALKASEYLLANDTDNPGLFKVTRVADGAVFSAVGDGAVIDGFSITLGVPAPAATDRFLLQPSSQAAADMKLALKNPRAVAAGSPVMASAALTNVGTASVGSLTVVAPAAGTYPALTLHFTDANGGYELLDSGNAVVDTGTWTSGQPISHDGWELRLDGLPANDDRFSIVPTPFPAGSNGNALAFDALAEQRLVDGETTSEAYAQMLAEMGVRVQAAGYAADSASNVAQRASASLQSEVGVNLDEEAARLIQFQQAYQAAARMLQTAQTMMDTVLQLGH